MADDTERIGLTVDTWRAMAQRSAASRNLSELEPLLAGLAVSLTTLRRAHAALEHPGLVTTPTPPAQS